MIVFGWQRGTNEFLVVAAVDLHEGLPIDELLIGGWQSEGPGRLPALAEESFNTGGPEEQKQPSLRRIRLQRWPSFVRRLPW